MNHRNKRITTYYILFSLLLVIGVVHAILQANLQINGTTKIANNQWNVHFDNIVVNPDSVPIGTDDTAAIIDPTNNCKVDFSVTLSLPGDFYEFTVDVENEGTIDAMIGSLEKTLKVNNVVTETIPEYLNYTVTYADGIEILENHLLAKNTSETYKVRLEFKTDINELPTGSPTITTSLEVQYIQADNDGIGRPKSLYGIMKTNAMIDNISSTFVTNDNGIQFNELSSDTNGKGIYLRAGTENDTYPIYYYRGAVIDNNLLFAGFCWKIVRTTDTGGIKLIYNGTPDNGVCNKTGIDATIGGSKYNSDGKSMSEVGYMYGTRYTYTSKSSTSITGPYLYGNSFTYSNGTYTLTNTITGTGTWSDDCNMIRNDNKHYTCFNTTGSCSTIYYVFNVTSFSDVGSAVYIELSNGKSVEDAVDEMVINPSNENNSVIKTKIDTWYQNNLIDYTNKIEDTIWCNDRSISSLGPWNPNSSEYYNLYFSSDNRLTTGNPIVTCPRKTDSFTVNESSTGNGKLIYPIGMVTSDEMALAGSIKIDNNDNHTQFYLYNFDNKDFWTMSPSYFNATGADAAGYGGARMFEMVFSGKISTSNANYVYYSYYVRPAISLKNNIIITSGDGTSTNPYTVE